jgi:hypothetical protein
MEIRRVVTGHGADGKAVFVDDQMVAPVTLSFVPGNEFHRFWGADSVQTFPDDGSRPESGDYFPPVGGFRFGSSPFLPTAGLVLLQTSISMPPWRSSRKSTRRAGGPPCRVVHR